MLFLMNIFRKFSGQIEHAQGSQRFHVLLVYFSILLDNLLLTVVVPVIPDFLVGIHEQQLQHSEWNENDFNKTINHSNHTFNHYIIDHHFGINGRSMAILNHYDPKTFNTENGQIGTILSSKAFVQLVFNPLVSPIINQLGYELTLILGVAVLFNSCLLYLIGQSFIMLLIPRAMQGIASSMINISGMSMVANMIRDEESRIGQIGFCLSGMATGVLIGYPFGSFFYQWFGKTTLFGIIVVSILLLLIAQLITINWSPTNAPTHYDSKTIDIITNSRVILFIVIISISTVTMSLLESFLPIWLIKEIRPPKWKLGVVFIPDSVGYLIGTNLFTLFEISIEYRWLLVIIALWTIGISAFMVPLIPNLLYLALPHFGIGLGIGTIDSTLWPMLAELVDEQFAAQYGYVYTASQTASSAAYAFGPLFGGALINRKIIHFESLMHLIGIVNFVLGLLALARSHSYGHFGKKKIQRSLSMINNDDNDDDSRQQMIALQQRFPLSQNYQRFD